MRLQILQMFVRECMKVFWITLSCGPVRCYPRFESVIITWICWRKVWNVGIHIHSTLHGVTPQKTIVFVATTVVAPLNAYLSQTVLLYNNTFELVIIFISMHVPCIFYYFVQWPTNAQLIDILSHSYLFGHYRVILRDVVVSWRIKDQLDVTC